LNPTKLGIVLKIAVNSLATIIEDMDDDWLFKVLMHHKGVVSEQYTNYFLVGQWHC
jgi:hypothetical protein